MTSDADKINEILKGAKPSPGLLLVELGLGPLWLMVGDGGDWREATREEVHTPNPVFSDFEQGKTDAR